MLGQAPRAQVPPLQGLVDTILRSIRAAASGPTQLSQEQMALLELAARSTEQLAGACSARPLRLERGGRGQFADAAKLDLALFSDNMRNAERAPETFLHALRAGIQPELLAFVEHRSFAEDAPEKAWSNVLPTGPTLCRWRVDIDLAAMVYARRWIFATGEDVVVHLRCDSSPQY